MAGNTVDIRITASGAEQAAKILQSVGAAGGQIGSMTVGGAKQAEASINTLGASAKRMFEIFTGVTASGAVAQLLALGKAAAASGLEALQAERAFRGMTEALSINADALLAKMERVSKGLADQSDIMLASARGLQQGLSEGQLVKVLELATDKAKLAGKSVAQAYGDISDAISENTVRSLKQFGIVLDLDDVMKKYARTLGTFPEALSAAEKTQAIFNATMEAAAKQTRAATTALDEQVDRLERNKVRIKGFWGDVGTVIVNAHGDLLAFWQDFNKAADDFGRRKMVELGVGLAPGPSEGRPGGIGTSDIGRGAPSVPVPIPPEVIAAPDLLKRALAEADHTLKMLNATMAAGQTTSADYAAALQVSIGKLQALGSALDEEGRLKLLGFQAALAGINFAKFQQDLTASLQATQAWGAGLLNSVKESVAQRNITVEQGAVAEADIRVAMLAAERVRLARGLADFKGNEAQKFQLEQQYAALGVQVAEAKSAARIAVWARDKTIALDLAATIQKAEATFGVTGDVAATLQTKITATQQALILANIAFGAGSVAALEFAKQLQVLVDAQGVLLARSRDLAAMMAELPRTLEEAAPLTVAEAEAWKQIDIAWRDAEKTGQALGGVFDLTSAKIALQTRAIQQLIAEGWDPLGEKVQAAVAKLNEFKGDQFTESLRSINVEAQLFGDRFDVVGARVSALEGRLRDMARTSNGEVKPAMRALADELENLRQFQDLREMFTDIFSSVQGAINTLVQGVILGTQTMAEAFKKLGQSIVIEFVNRVIQQALNPLMKAAAGVVAALFTGTPGTGASSPGAVAAIGEAGEPSALGTIGFQNTANSLGNFTSALGLATGGTGAFSQVLTGITSGWDAGFGGATAALSGGFEALQAVSAAASGLTVGLAGVGAALAVFSTTMDFVNGKTEEAIGGLVGGIAGGVAGGIWFGPLGALVGGALGDLLGSWLGGLFGGGPGNYELKRAMAEADANAQVGGITTGFAAAAHAGTSAATLAGLQSGQAPWGSTPNPLRTDLSLPPALAEQLGLAAKAELENGRAIVHWADVTQAQFDELITLFKSDPSMIAGSVRGKGDVSYLGQDKTHALGDQLEQGAVALLTAFTAFDSVRDKINGLAADIVGAAGEVMPPNMAEQLAAHIVNPIRDGMLAVLQDPDLSVEDMQAELDKMGATLEAKVASWEQFAQAMQAAQIIAPSMPDDLPERMTAALAPAYDAVVTTMRNGTARQAQAAADGYAKQVALWAAFGEAVTHAIDLEAILPEDLGSRFEAKMQPQYDKILATLESGNVSLATAQVAAYTKQMAAWASIGQTVSKITSELAANSGDTSSAVETWQAVQGEMDRTVARAKVAFDAAVNSGDIERVAKTAATYHDATMARLQAERAAIQQVEAAFDTLLKAAAAVEDTLAGLAAADVGRGDATAFTDILHGLADIAMVAPTVQQRLAAVGSGLSAIVTALGNADVDALINPLTLIAQTSSAVAPFFGALSDLIETATKGGDLKGALGLMQQQVDAIKQLGAAAVQAVREWATAAIAAIEKEAAAKSKAIDEQADREIKLREAAIKNWQAQLAIAQTIESLYTGPNSPLSLTQQVAAAAGAGQAALARFQAAPSAAGLTAVQNAATRYLTIFTSLINDQIALLQRWQSAVDSANGFIESLYTGPNSPLSLTEQRGLAAGAGQSALSAYNAGPTPEGLTALQAAASRYLTISLAQIREKADAEIAAVEASRDARVSALNAEIQAVQDAAAAEQQLIADRIDALQEQVSITREWEGVVKSVGDLIQSMVIGPMAAGNPADRLTAAKDAFAQSQAAFNANPTAANAADVQSAAQALLPLAESLLSKPSPAYQALFASVIKVLEGVKGTAGAMAGPVSSADLEKQIKPLQEESKRIGEYAKQTVIGIQAQIEAVNKSAADTIKAINEAATQEAKDITKGVIDALTAATSLAPQDLAGQKAAKEKELKDTVAAVIGILAEAGQINGMSSDDLSTLIAGAQAQIDWWTHWRETETALVEKLKQAQIDAINATATTTIKNIQEGVAAALRENAAAQKTITEKLVADTAAIAAAVTRGAGSGLIDGVAFLAERSMEANGTLVEIRDAIRSVTGAATGMERVKEGLYHLHDDEMVVPKAMADQIRSAATGAGLPDDDPHHNDWNWIYNQPRDLSKEGQAWAGPKAAELNALELKAQQIMQQFEGTLAHNVQKKGGRRVQIYSDDEIALMRDAMTNQVKAIKDEQIAIIATVPKTPATPPTPPGTPPTVPPKVPPYTPPGPGWLTKTEGEQTDRSGGVTLVIEKGAIVITGVSDPEKAANLAVEKVQTSVASGKIGLIIDKRVRSLPAR